MKCPNCGAEVNEQSVFCPQCGAKLSENPASEQPGGQGRENMTAQSSGSAGLRDAASARMAAGDTSEEELWQGAFSPKAMYGTWILCGLLTVAAIVLAALFMPPEPLYWGILLLAVVACWLVPLAMLAYRRMAVRYRLTNQRFFHEHGILRRRTDRIEVIDMDDIGFEQGFIERMLGVGTIHVTSSDRTHPKLAIKGIDDVARVASLIDDMRRKERIRRGLFVESI